MSPPGRDSKVSPVGSVVSTLTAIEALLLREGVFTQPMRLASPPSWVEHIPFAFWIVSALKPAVLVELGTKSGNSYSAFAQAVQRFDLSTACYAIDPGSGASQADEARLAEWSAFHDRHFAGFSRLVRSTPDEASAMFGDRSIDLLHIDQGRTYDTVRHAFETWLPKLSARGVMLVHDINLRAEDVGAWKVWEEIQGTYPTFAFLHGNGLGVVGVGDGLPPEVQWLLSTLPRVPHETTRVQQFFARLGLALQRDWQVTDLQHQQHALTARVAELEALALTQAKASEALASELVAAREARERQAVNPQRKRVDDDVEDEEIDEDERERQADELAGRDPVRAERERLKAIIEELDSERAASEADAAALRVTVAAMERERGRTAQTLTSVSRELERTHRHWTWRATSPLRRSGDLGLGPLLQVRSPRSAISILRLMTKPQRLLEMRRVTLSGLFDEDYYRSRHEDVRRAGTPAAVHYALAGAREGRAPHPLFDAEFYLERYPDVRAVNANPLLHFMRSGQAEGRDPHPLFSMAYYRKRHPEIVKHPTNALLHFLSTDPSQGDSPHPLFDPAYYLEHAPEAAAEDIHPLLHFLTRGAFDGRAPHPLFDMAFYLRQNADVRKARHNPLMHYLTHVPGEDRDPHPLFDSSFYLDAAPDLVERGVNPLAHFVEHGWREGRRPNPAFDPRWYLEVNRDVAETGENPLAHFDRIGWREGRDPSPDFSVADYLATHPDIAVNGANPLHHYLVHGVKEGRPVRARRIAARRLPPSKSVQLRVEGTADPTASRTTPTIVCVTHVIPWPPRAGNEYRVLRMLEWLTAQGYRVVLLLSPLPTESVSPEQLEALVARIGNVALCDRDGELQYRLSSCPDIFAELDGRRTRNYAARLGERSRLIARKQELVRIERSYCHDALIEVALEAVDGLRNVVLLAEYVWMSRLLPLVGERVPKLLDTHDMYSTKANKVLSFGVADMELSSEEEAERLARADLVLAIQDNERALMQALVPSTDVITVGVDVDVPSTAPTPPEPNTVLIVGSGNALNRIGIRDFLRFAWPSIVTRVPDATLIVAGPVGRFVPEDAPRVENVGPVDDLTPLYTRARVVVNPTAAGTGLKIKTVEALTHNRPVVTWPNGFDGIPESIRQTMALPNDWIEFANHVVSRLQAEGCGLDPETHAAVRAFVSSSTAYGALGDRLTQLFGRMAGSTRPSPRS